MARKFLTAIDMAKGEIQNLTIHNLAAAPSSPVKGQIYMNTSDNVMYWWNGTAWVAASPGTGFPGYGSVPAETTFGIARADGVATTVSRSDHTHGSPTHDNAAHSAITLNSLAAPTGAVSFNGQLLTNVATPVSANDGTNKSYVDNLINGLSWKDTVRAATTTNGTLASAFANGSVIDGVTLATGNRILIKNQTTTSENGLYTVNASGAPTRATDADIEAELLNMSVWVSEGTTLADTAWVLTTNAPITVGTTGLTYVQSAGTGGAVPPSRLINTTAPLTGGGDLSADRTLAISAATESAVGAVELATTAEASAGSDTTRAVTPAGLTAWGAVSGAKRYAVDVGGATSQVITHNLGTLDVLIQVYRKASPFDVIECDMEHTSTTTATLRFTTAPSAAEYRAVVLA